MSKVHGVKLELMRQGPEHNQLLSPITAYLALCGNAPPHLVHMPFEHWQLVLRLARLRDAERDTGAADREAALREIGEPIGRLFGEVPALYAALERAGGEELVHLQLSLAALELSMMPFEAAIAPDHFPGGRGPLLLRTPTVLTREVRRNQRADVSWDRPPRVLFAFASPGALAPVPAQQHLNALRRAIAPLVRQNDQADPQRNEDARLAEVAKLIKVLPDATWASIADACRTDEVTHLHLLAHGVPIDGIGGRRFGIALCAEGDRDTADVVDGDRLVAALHGSDAAGRGRPLPTLVSLATCDSGAVDTVLVAGGSIAHELHGAGVPWVVASQFPLWMDASVKLADVLYEGLLAGDDPRWVLREARRRLHAEVPDSHDWAGLVCYATIPFDLDRQVDAFRERQLRERIEVRFSMIDARIAHGEGRLLGEAADAVERLAGEIREMLAAWPQAAATAARQAERLTIGGAGEKRLAIVYQRVGDAARAGDAYRRAADSYEAALRLEPLNHWATTQFLALMAIPQLTSEEALAAVGRRLRPSWVLMQQVAEAELVHAQGKTRAWAFGTLAELALLGSVYAGEAHDPQAAAARIGAACRDLVQTAGADAFPVASTRRQFLRYRDFWPRERWASLVAAALAELPD